MPACASSVDKHDTPTPNSSMCANTGQQSEDYQQPLNKPPTAAPFRSPNNHTAACNNNWHSSMTYNSVQSVIKRRRLITKAYSCALPHTQHVASNPHDSTPVPPVKLVREKHIPLYFRQTLFVAGQPKRTQCFQIRQRPPLQSTTQSKTMSPAAQ